MNSKKRKSELKRLSSKLIERRRVSESGCWLWLGSDNGGGHGKVWAFGKAHYVHRISMIVFRGLTIGESHVLHKCDIPSCFNPKHLYLGTEKQNSKDRMARGFQCRGERIGTSRLTEDVVRSIKNDALIYKQRTVAKKYGIHQVSVSRIARGTTWKHLWE